MKVMDMKTTSNIWFLSLAMVGMLLLLISGCEKQKQNDEYYPVASPTPPKVTTVAASSITPTTATSGGNVTSNGGATVTAKGVCWSTSANPTTAGAHTADSSVSQTFSSNITGLTLNTLYYVRAYATNIVGIAYGNQVSFTTTNPVPTVLTNTVTNITTGTATSGGYVTSDGGQTVTVRGICWGTSANPTTADAHTSDGSGTGNFISSLTGLSTNTSYYVRAYASNSFGTAYGNQVTFTTSSVLTVTTDPITKLNETDATGGGVVVSDGGNTVTARGVCWSTSVNPSLFDPHTVNGSGTGDFTSHIAGLCLNTTYYVRAYATNSTGTVYGNQISFLTPFGTGQTVTDVDGNLYHTITIGTQVWMLENLKTMHYRNGDAILVSDGSHWGGLTTGAYCNYNDDSVTANTYGRLYNWYATSDIRNICPCGWHVPTDDEWSQLVSFLGGAAVAGGALKESGTSHWASPNTGATDSSGFTALPAGYRLYDGSFNDLTKIGLFWTSTTYSTKYSYYYQLSNTSNAIYPTNQGLIYTGMSVRCVKN